MALIFTLLACAAGTEYELYHAFRSMILLRYANRYTNRGMTWRDRSAFCRGSAWDLRESEVKNYREITALRECPWHCTKVFRN